MDEERNPEKSNTVAALLLHSLVLLELAALLFLLSFTPEGTLKNVDALLPSVFFGALSVIAFWLTIKHNRDSVREKNLKTWASIHIAASTFAFIIYFRSFGILIDYNPPSQAASLAFLILLLIYPIPPLLIHIFAGRERT